MNNNFNANSAFRILAIGDVVGPNGVKLLAEKLWSVRKTHEIDMVICNAENAAIGNGLDPQAADRLLAAGCDVLTGGNHIFRKKEIKNYLDDSEYAIRPANYPNGTPGNGYTIVNIDGYRVLVLNLLGVVYLEAMNCPFETAERIFRREEGQFDFAIVDIHAEATSEKLAIAHFLDGRASVVFGTHTHVPTADTTVLPRGTGYVTDLGMTGPHDGILGVRADIIVDKMRTKLPQKFELSEGDIRADAVIFPLDSSGKCLSAERISF